MPDGLNKPGLCSESCTNFWRACVIIKAWKFYIIISSTVFLLSLYLSSFYCCCCCCCFIVIIIISIIIITTVNYHLIKQDKFFDMHISCKMCIFFKNSLIYNSVAMSKRKSTELGVESATRKTICIIHNEDSKAENFVYLKESSFQKICDIRDKRLSLPIGSKQRMEKECAQIPADISSGTGYHRDCYQKFTMNLKRLQVVENEEKSRTKRASRGNGNESIIFSPECIFCNRSERKKIKVKGTWTTEGTSTFDLGGGESLQRLVEKRKDEDMARRIRGYDLFACEAQYHRSCRMNYNDRAKWRSKNEENKQIAIDRALAHDICFQKICTVIDKEIVHEQNVVRHSELTKSYVSHLETTNFANPSYRRENLKKKISNTYSDKVGFVALDRARGKFQNDLVYSTETNLGTAIKNGYMLG